ncbi:hypothetical protein FRB97_007480 [Tulasnella sp. 331]|nr:hypothetical protein FRB97_007480 [Tulasnella sp. 331]KAG8884599.1 hypothetical protein FRB98_002313 [Tulasnella sp. 332]
MRSLVEPDVIGPIVLSTETMVFASTEVLTTFERPSSPVEDFYNSYFADETSEHDINAWGQMYI